MDWVEIEKVVEFWERLDLIKFRSNYDRKGLEIAAVREDCSKNRKNLSTITKDFRKLEDDVKLGKFGSLVKSYQQEVNNLTQRGRKAEQNFLEILNYLREITDPTPVLKKVIENEKKYQVNKLVKKNEEMELELDQYKKEFKEIKNQEVTIRHLENQIQYLVDQQEMKKSDPSQTQSGPPNKEGDLIIDPETGLPISKNENNGEEEGEDEEEEQKFDVVSLLANYQDQIETLKENNYELEKMVDQNKGLYTQSENKLRAMSLELSKTQQSHQQELELVRGDLEKYQIEEATRNQESEKLREYQNQEQHYLQLERLVKEKERRIRSLTTKLNLSESTINKIEEGHNKIEKEIRTKDKIIEELEEDLSKRPKLQEFEEIRTRLETLEKIEFGDLEEESKKKDDDQEKKKPSIEALLNRKLKRQEHEFTNIKNELSEKSLECSKFEITVRTLTEKVQSQTSLIENLENDLMNIQREEDDSMMMMSETGIMMDGENDVVIMDNQSSASTSFGGGMKSSSTSSMLNAVIQQRNRLKTKLQILKEKNVSSEEKINIQKIEINRLKADNIKMYEKIRYIESYNTGDISIPPSPRTSVHREQGTGDTIVTVNRFNGGGEKNRKEGTDGRYRRLYEEKLNQSLVESPFQQFSKKEKREQFKKLSFAERLTLITTGKMLRNRSGRMFLFIYTFSLHLLVFFMCYYVVRRCQ